MPRAWSPGPLMLRGYGYEMDPHNDARSGARLSNSSETSLATINSTKKFRRLLTLPSGPDHAHSGKPQSLARIAAQFTAVHGARPISSVSARIGARSWCVRLGAGRGSCRSCRGQQRLAWPISRAKLSSSDHPAGQASGFQETNGVQHHAAGIREPATPSRRWGDAPSRRRAIRHADQDQCSALTQSRWKSRRTDSL